MKKYSTFIRQLTLFKCFLFLLVAIAFAGCKTTKMDTMADSSALTPTHSEIVTLREGDVLKIRFPGSANLDTTQQVRRDGKITLPLIGEVNAVGETPEGLRQTLITLYAPQISSKEVFVAVESSAFPIFVTGCVIRPGKVSSDQPITALEAIMGAGGFDYAKANLKGVRVIRREHGVSESHTLNLKRVMQGKDNAPFYLKPSDIVYVPERFSWF